MIQRVILLKLKQPFSTDAGRKEVEQQTRTVLPSLPGVQSVTVGIPAEAKSLASWDVCITVNFDALEAVESYQVHPDHRAYVDSFLTPRLEVIKAWNFHLGS